MMKPTFSAMALFAVALFVFQPLAAQTESLRVTVANLNQDLDLIAKQVSTLRLEIEEIRRENARLRSQVSAASSNRDAEASLLSAMETLRREYRAGTLTPADLAT